MSHSLERILYVEDDPSLQTVARMALERLGGFTVSLCGNGAQAAEQARVFRPDLILLDVMMPGMDGPTTLQTLRRDEELAGIPVVFVTAKAQPEEIQRWRAMGARDVITKPYDPLKLPAQLRSIWEHRDAPR